MFAYPRTLNRLSVLDGVLIYVPQYAQVETTNTIKEGASTLTLNRKSHFTSPIRYYIAIGREAPFSFIVNLAYLLRFLHPPRTVISVNLPDSETPKVPNPMRSRTLFQVAVDCRRAAMADISKCSLRLAFPGLEQEQQWSMFRG